MRVCTTKLAVCRSIMEYLLSMSLTVDWPDGSGPAFCFDSSWFRFPKLEYYWNIYWNILEYTGIHLEYTGWYGENTMEHFQWYRVSVQTLLGLSITSSNKLNLSVFLYKKYRCNYNIPVIRFAFIGLHCDHPIKVPARPPATDATINTYCHQARPNKAEMFLI